MQHPGRPRGIAIALLLAFTGCVTQAATDEAASGAFPRGLHSLLPPENGQRVSVGVDPQPVDQQPIAFRHDLHAGAVADGGMGMDCQYCHANARRSQHAGVPPTEVCMGCHKMVDPTGRPALVALKEYADSGKPIPWVKVHDLPDFVRFSHAPHVAAGVACQECHGPVQTFTVGRRQASLLMGWCLECHEKHPSVDQRYGSSAELRRAELKDCTTCHK